MIGVLHSDGMVILLCLSILLMLLALGAWIYTLFERRPEQPAPRIIVINATRRRHFQV